MHPPDDGSNSPNLFSDASQDTRRREAQASGETWTSPMLVTQFEFREQHRVAWGGNPKSAQNSPTGSPSWRSPSRW